MIVLDTGSGNTCENDTGKVREMIDAIKDSGIDAVIKWQLFEDEPPCIKLEWDVFEFAVQYATEMGYETTASFFDKKSLEFLQTFNVPFYKIANRTYLRPMARLIKDKPILVSYQSSNKIRGGNDLVRPLCCVSNYPADIADYERLFTAEHLAMGISDHTVGLDLYHKYQPAIFEKHFVLKHNKKDPDAGPFSLTPKDLEALCI